MAHTFYTMAHWLFFLPNHWTPHRPNSKSERNLIILQVNINGLRNKLEELKLLIHDTHADIITIQETKLTHSREISFIVIVIFLIIQYCCRFKFILNMITLWSMTLTFSKLFSYFQIIHHSWLRAKYQIQCWLISFLIHVVWGTNSALGLIVFLHDHQLQGFPSLYLF